MLTLLSINWNPNPELFNLFGSLPIRYYGLLWVVGIALAYVIVHRQYHDRKIDEKTFEPLFFYCFFGILIGARLGHCLFYQPDYYLNHFWEMILPVKFLPDGGWKFTGYEGLASHGGTLGLIIALWMYCRKTKMHYVPWAFVFERVDMLPRHPAQLYEAIAYFIFFLGMVYLYRRGQKQQENKLKTDFSTTKAKSTAVQTGATLPYHRGFFFGLCLTEIFVFRFFIEFLKEDQVDFESAMTLNMGQWLSIPFILIGVYFMCFHGKKTTGK